MSIAADRFLELLPQIDSISTALSRRRGLSEDDAQEFAAAVRARFVETDYAALRQFRGDAAVTTYLAVVIASWLHDQLISEKGRWRPSAAALREGPVGVLLERLTHRDGRTVDQAVEEIRSGSEAAYTERELRAIIRRLPARQPSRPRLVGSDAAGEVPAADTSQPDTLLEQTEEARLRTVAVHNLDLAMHHLDVEDRTMIAMRFMDGLSVADIARTLRLDPKPLYRRIERTLGVLKRHLESNGVTASTIRETRSHET